MIKVLTVFGTRPEAIKMAPLVREFAKYADDGQFDARVCVTGQHRQMLDQVMEIFGIKPDYDLDIMKEGQDLFDITTAVLNGMKPVLDEFKPDIVLVHGDTGTSTAAALAAFYRQVDVGHVEAGLRTYNRYSPWPEEMNRQLTGRLANLHFSPTQMAAQNLKNEKVDPETVFITGNTVIDALHIAVGQLNQGGEMTEALKSKLQSMIADIDAICEKGQFILVTGHRRENFGHGFLEICRAIKEVALEFPSWNIIYPVHLNPNVQKPVRELLSNIPNVHLIQPLEYLPFVYLMSRCSFVVSDSGGIQEEAPGLGKPVLVMRDTTERPEALEAGTVRLVGTDSNLIIDSCRALIEDRELYKSMATAKNPFGDGKAAKRIVEIIKTRYSK